MLESSVPGTFATSTPIWRKPRVNGHAVPRPAAKIPHVGRNRAARATDTAHFGESTRPVRNEIEDQGRCYDVETSVGKRQCLSVSDAKIRQPPDRLFAGIIDLCRRWIDGDNRSRRRRIQHQLRENARTATDIEPACAFGRRDPSEESLAHGTAPAPHEPLISRGIIKNNSGVIHVIPPAKCHAVKPISAS
jgi:hypothetical protein